MEKIAPIGPIYQAGTLSGNPLAMTAGIETLKLLGKPGVYKTLEKSSADLEQGLRAAAAEAGVPVTFNRVGSMFTGFFTEQKVKDFASAKTSDTGTVREVFPCRCSRTASISRRRSSRRRSCPWPIPGRTSPGPSKRRRKSLKVSVRLFMWTA